MKKKKNGDKFNKKKSKTCTLKTPNHWKKWSKSMGGHAMVRDWNGSSTDWKQSLSKSQLDFCWKWQADPKTCMEMQGPQNSQKQQRKRTK